MPLINVLIHVVTPSYFEVDALCEYGSRGYYVCTSWYVCGSRTESMTHYFEVDALCEYSHSSGSRGYYVCTSWYVCGSRTECHGSMTHPCSNPQLL